MRVREEYHVSRFTEALPVAAAWHTVSDKSGPHSNACTFMPLRTRARISPIDSNIFPLSEANGLKMNCGFIAFQTES